MPLADTADLLVTNFVAYTGFNEPFPIQRTVLFTFDVYNIGSADATNVPVAIYIDGEYQGTHTITRIRSGYATRISMNLKGKETGTHPIRLIVNPDSTIVESDYSNNTVTRTFTWVEQNQVIDFVAVSLESEYGTELPIDTVTFTCSIANAGGTDDSVPMCILVNGTQVLYGSTGILPAGMGANYTFDLTFNSEAEFVMELVVDPNDTIDEWNEVNNTCEEDFIIIDDSSDAKYGRLGFGYPLSEQYTGYFDYKNHNGFDISAPLNSEIYSIDSGIVTFAGFDSTTGYYIAICNDTLDPNKDTDSPIITRYLHINLSQNVFVKAGDSVVKGQKIGLVGSRGTYVGEYRLNHLHIDANSNNILSGPPGSSLINPKLFWPNVEFYAANGVEEYPGYDSDWNGTNSNMVLSSNDIGMRSTEQQLKMGSYVDCQLINLIGEENFELWLTTQENQWTVYDLIQDFNISEQQLEETLASHVYEAYMEYWK